MQKIVWGLSLAAVLFLLPASVSSEMDEVYCCIRECS